MVKVIKINPNWKPKPITEGEVWQGNPLFPNELRDENEKLLIFEDENKTPFFKGYRPNFYFRSESE